MSGAHVSSVEPWTLGLIEDEERQEAAQGNEVEEWPDELQFLQGKRFVSEEELKEELEKRGLGDAPVLVGPDGLVELHMPSDPHNKATRHMDTQFTLWAPGRTGDWGIADHEAANVYYRNAQGHLHKRCPDVSFWGANRLEKDARGNNRVKKLAGGVEMEPHVAIQVSCGNTSTYEEGAINDLMKHAVVHAGNEPVQVGYLIKVWYTTTKKISRPSGFLIFRVPRGQNMPPRNQPTLVYTHGGTDVEIVIKANDLGYTGISAWMCGSFKLSMEKLWNKMY